jgi:hypothetical protein
MMRGFVRHSYPTVERVAVGPSASTPHHDWEPSEIGRQGFHRPAAR